MNISIKNFGPIKRAEVNLYNNLIIFCGPNGTGKTYMSYLLNAIRNEGFYIKDDLIKNLTLEYLKERSFSITIDTLNSLIPLELDYFKNRLGDIFGISDEVANSLFKNFELKREPLPKPNTKSFFKTIEGISLELKNSNVIVVEFDDWLYKSVDDIEAHKEDADFIEYVIRHLLIGILYGGVPLSKMLSVERNSIYTFKKELSNNRNNLVDTVLSFKDKQKQSAFDYISNNSRRYPSVIKDSLSIANDLVEVQKTRGEYYELATKIESDLLHGNVVISKEGDVEFAVNKNVRLPIQMSSSIVKTMSSLVIYLKHRARKGETIIIDEPEMNLHPDSQRILAQIFALLVNNGLRLVISTHSDYIIREINNLIMANGVKAENKDEYLAKIGYNKDIVLDKDMVGAYFFKPKSAKSVVVESLKVDDTGFAVPTIDDTINRQNELAEQLYYDLKYGGDSDEDND